MRLFLDNKTKRLPTPLFVPSVAMFCYHFRYKLRVSAWAVGSCSIGPPAGGILEISIFQTLRLTGRIALYMFLHGRKRSEAFTRFV